MGAKDQGFGFTPGFLQVVNVLFLISSVWLTA